MSSPAGRTPQGPHRPPPRFNPSVKRPHQLSVRQSALKRKRERDRRRKQFEPSKTAPVAGGGSKKIYTGPRGGRYYKTKTGNKTYI